LAQRQRAFSCAVLSTTRAVPSKVIKIALRATTTIRVPSGCGRDESRPYRGSASHGSRHFLFT
jgi:hypothetical protein